MVAGALGRLHLPWCNHEECERFVATRGRPVGSTTGDGVVRLALGCFPLAIQYAGRHGRRKEPFVDQISVMSKSIGGELVSSVADKGFGVFDRSMGAVLAVEVRRKLDSKHGLIPDLLPASGRRAPSRVRPEPGTHPSRLSDPESLPDSSPTTCPTTTLVGSDDP